MTDVCDDTPAFEDWHLRSEQVSEWERRRHGNWAARDGG